MPDRGVLRFKVRVMSKKKCNLFYMYPLYGGGNTGREFLWANVAEWRRPPRRAHVFVRKHELRDFTFNWLQNQHFSFSTRVSSASVSNDRFYESHILLDRQIVQGLLQLPLLLLCLSRTHYTFCESAYHQYQQPVQLRSAQSLVACQTARRRKNAGPRISSGKHCFAPHLYLRNPCARGVLD